jgi:hypothetical protein
MKNRKKQNKIASEIQNLNKKCTVHPGPKRPSNKKSAHGHLPAAAWAPGPKTNGWAAKAAQRRPPAWAETSPATAVAPPPSIARSTAEIDPA